MLCYAAPCCAFCATEGENGPKVVDRHTELVALGVGLREVEGLSFWSCQFVCFTFVLLESWGYGSSSSATGCVLLKD